MDDFDKFIRDLEHANANFESELTQTINKLGAKLYRKTVQRTPKRENKGKIRGGTLIKNWQIKNTGKYEVKISNNTEYGIFVEFGHRARNGRPVEGKYMLKRSFEEVQSEADKELHDMMDRLFKG